MRIFERIVRGVVRRAERVGRRGVREPVLLFGAIAAAIAAWAPFLVDTDKEVAAVAAITLYLQRRFSTSKANAADQVETERSAARAEALADVASLAPPAPAKRAAARKKPAPRKKEP